MKKLDGSEFSNAEIMNLLSNVEADTCTINLDILYMSEVDDHHPPIPMASINFNDDLGKKDLMKLLVFSDGGYSAMFNLANYLDMVGKMNTKIYNKPSIEKSMVKVSNIIRAAANRMLHDSNKEVEDIKSGIPVVKLLVDDK